MGISFVPCANTFQVVKYMYRMCECKDVHSFCFDKPITMKSKLHCHAMMLCAYAVAYLKITILAGIVSCIMDR